METSTKIIHLVLDDNTTYSLGNLLPQPEGHDPEPIQIDDIAIDENGDFVIVASPDTDEPADPPEDLDPDLRLELLQKKKEYIEKAKAFADNRLVVLRQVITDKGSRVAYYDTLTNSDDLATAQKEDEANGAQASS